MNKKNLVLLLMLLVISNSIIYGMSVSSDDKENIVLDKSNSWENSERPRSLDMLVWTCYYENGKVYLNVPFEIGCVSLTITNITTGEVWSFKQESGWGWISLPTSETSGNYRVEVRTESHGDYIGYYNL